MHKELTINDILKMLLNRIKLIIILCVLFAASGYIYASFFITPLYSARSLILVQNSDYYNPSAVENNADSNKTGEKEENDKQYLGSNIVQSEKLANTCAEIFKLDPDMRSIIGNCSVNITIQEDTYFLWISVTSSDPKQAQKVANDLAYKAPVVYKKYFQSGSVFIVNEASEPLNPSSPNVSKNTTMGLGIGLVLGVVIAFILELVDTTIKPSDDLFKIYGIPVFAEIIDFEAEGGKKK